MRLITQRKEVLHALRRAGLDRAPLLCPNAETPEEMEGVLLAAQRHAQKRDRGPVVVGLGFTAGYPDHGQLTGLALEGRSLAATAELWLHWLQGYTGRAGLFDGVEVIPFLDHGWAPQAEDLALMQSGWFQEALGILMFDASACDFAENVRLTAAFVQEAGNHVVVEACPDKVYERAELERKGLHEADLLSRPEQVERFVRETGVDLIVPNLGTEHRTTSKTSLEYRHDLAQEIARRVGPIQALHGTSSLGGRLAAVGVDGICKINYYTAMARAATAAVQTAWAKHEQLPLAEACGSFLHRTRRDAMASNVEALLAQLDGAGSVS